ncbi:ankycorbin-like [Pecten maximus]|uniref:ankycorbin-like n=1 Tax=Pecten maximus TaxID=6579 RepID=UPI001458C2CD|nr:ankycorbin-like [Pecten maximus]
MLATMSVIVAKPMSRSYALATAAGITESELNTRDANGRTILFYASRNGKTQVVKNLLNAGSDPNIPDVEGSTPLHEATERCHLDIVKILLKNDKTDINAKNRNGQTALMKSVLYDDVEALKILHKAGGHIDELDSTGKTAFMIAMADGRERTSEYLIKNGCDINIVDKLGQSALYLAFTSTQGMSTDNIRRLLKAGYITEKDRVWLAKAGMELNAFQHKNFFQRIKDRITTPSGRRHSEGFMGRNTIHLGSGVSHAHPRFRSRNNSSFN